MLSDVASLHVITLNLIPMFIGMHRNAPLSPMNRVPGYTIPMVPTQLPPMAPMNLVIDAFARIRSHLHRSIYYKVHANASKCSSKFEHCLFLKRQARPNPTGAAASTATPST